MEAFNAALDVGFGEVERFRERPCADVHGRWRVCLVSRWWVFVEDCEASFVVVLVEGDGAGNAC